MYGVHRHVKNDLFDTSSYFREHTLYFWVGFKTFERPCITGLGGVDV